MKNLLISFLLSLIMVLNLFPQNTIQKTNNTNQLYTKEDWKALTGNPWEVGTSVANAGDVNGDGYDDVIVGAPGYWQNKGKIFIYYGSATGLSAYPNWTAETSQNDSFFGTMVNSAGDVNGDGYSDIIVSAPKYDNNQTNGGMVFVWYGSSSGLGSPGTPANADWSVESSVDYSDFGNSVASAGDVNGDGYEDVIVGDDQYDNSLGGQGKVFVYYGSSSGLSTSSDWTDEVYDGVGGLEYYGYSVSSAGDVNNDGYGDVIVGAKSYEHDGHNGAVFIYYGSNSGLSNLQVLESRGQFGNSVSCAGDVNGDGFDDILIGAKNYDPDDNQYTTNDGGAAFVFLGSGSGILTTPVWSKTSESILPTYNSIRFGTSVSSAGDIDNDGYDDIIVGAPNYYNGTHAVGAAFVFKGNSGGVSLSEEWMGESNIQSAEYGHSVSSAGDVDGDGFDDIIVGAPNINFQLGMAYAYYGGNKSYYPSGSGTENDPYQISTLNDLYWIYKHSDKWGDYFIQTADIDATDTQNFDDGNGGTAEGFRPIGDHDYGNFLDFKGNYDGQGYSIDNLTIKRASVTNNENIGLFGFADSATFSNINLSSIDIEGNRYVGGLVGYSVTSTIKNCDVSGSLNGTDSNDNDAGGLVGYLTAGSQVSNCNSNVNVTGAGSELGGLVGSSNYNSTIDSSRSFGSVTGQGFTDFGGLIGFCAQTDISDSYSFSNVSGQHYSGGFIGEITDHSTITNCFSAGNVVSDSYTIGGFVGYLNYQSTITNSYSTGNATGNQSVGGFIGYNSSANSGVDNCYSRGSVTRISTSTDTSFGGFCGNGGDGGIEKCYSTGAVHYDGATDPTNKGFVGDPNSGTYSDNYWDMDASLQSSTGGTSYATGETTTNMKNESTFINWDFTTPVWETNSNLNDGYPFLTFQHFENVNITLQSISTSPMVLENLRIGFTAENSSADVTFHYKKTDPPNLPPDPSYINKYWDIMSVSGDMVKLRLYYSPSDVSGFSGDPTIFHYDGTDWVELPTTPEMTDGNLRYVETTNYYSGFSPVTIGDASSPLPVELNSLYGNFSNNNIELTWNTATEINNYGFEIERLQNYVDNKLQNSWQKIGFVKGNGNSNSNKSYSFVDDNPPPAKKLAYRLKQVDFDGNYKFSGEIEIKNVPGRYSLSQNYPNPFNPTTTIRYEVPKEGFISLKIYDILGREVKTLVSKKQTAGKYRVTFNASEFASGIYFYRLHSNNFSKIKKMILLK